MDPQLDGLTHRPVLYHQIIHFLQPHRGGRFVDCTLGAGGHAWGLLNESSPDGLLLGLDVDPTALDLARQRLQPFGDRAIIARSSYVLLKEQMEKCGWKSASGILIDLGLSSMQLDNPERGFSFSSDAPLDMRYDPDSLVNATDLVNSLPEKELADLIYRYGEEKYAFQIAREIVLSRPINRTSDMAEIVAKVVKKKRASIGRNFSSRERIHPATRTFQALRIAVNHELESLEMVLPQAVDVLSPGGRLAVISFHSLEDRIVKLFFRRESQDCICPPQQVVCTCDHQAIIKEVVRKPIRPTTEEISLNPRSRSARLRVAEKLATLG
jgi:16S rRNA (cytosine1402-N4)-methyltransferase